MQQSAQLPAPYLAGARAGFVSRLLALAIDVVLLVLVLLVENALWAALVGSPPVRWLRDALVALAPGLQPWIAWIGLVIPVTIGLVIVCGYFVFFFTITGQTIGKRLIGLQVVAADGGRLPLRRAALRLIGYLISALPLYLGFLAALVDKRQRAWHDRIAGSAVIYAWDARPDERFLGRAIKRLE